MTLPAVRTSMLSLVRVATRARDSEAYRSLRKRFFQWRCDEDIFWYEMRSGGPSWSIDYYTPEDAKKVRRWLEQQPETAKSIRIREPKI